MQTEIVSAAAHLLALVRAHPLLFAFVCVTQPAVFATTMYLHRGSAHGSVVFRPWLRWCLECTLWFTTGLVGGARKYWVALHRKHHAFTDVPGDPHSPYIEGKWQVEFLNLYYYLRERKRDPKLMERAKDVRFSWSENRLFRPAWLGPLLGTGILCVLFGPRWGLYAAGFHAFIYVVILNGAVNGLCHWWGYKDFPEADAHNVRLVAWLSGGEGLHEHHHKYPNSPFLAFPRRLKKHRGEWDPAGRIISWLIRLKLASLPPKAVTVWAP